MRHAHEHLVKSCLRYQGINQERLQVLLHMTCTFCWVQNVFYKLCEARHVFLLLTFICILYSRNSNAADDVLVHALVFLYVQPLTRENVYYHIKTDENRTSPEWNDSPAECGETIYLHRYHNRSVIGLQPV